MEWKVGKKWTKEKHERNKILKGNYLKGWSARRWREKEERYFQGGINEVKSYQVGNLYEICS